MPDIISSQPDTSNIGKDAVLTSFNDLGQENKTDHFVAQEIFNEDVISPQSPEAPFEEILESREMIEERIFSIKSRMIDFVIRQWDIERKMVDFNSDVSVLQTKIDDSLVEQSQALEVEDYDKADAIDNRMKAIKQ